MKLKNKKYQGFSFIDSILAIFILSMGIIAVLELMSSSMRVSLEAKNYNIAVSLAQEGVELVRNIGDNDWSSFDNLPDPNESNCQIDIDSSSIELCSVGDVSSSESLCLDDNGFYTYNRNGLKTKFYRKVTFNRNGGNGYKITSMVVWEGKVDGWGQKIFPSIINCNEANYCAYAQVILKNWKQ